MYITIKQIPMNLPLHLKPNGPKEVEQYQMTRMSQFPSFWAHDQMALPHSLKLHMAM